MPRPDTHLPAGSPPRAQAFPFPDVGFLRQPQVLAVVPISKSTLWRRIQQRSFPEPVKLSPGVTAWRVEDIRAWVERQGGAR